MIEPSRSAAYPEANQSNRSPIWWRRGRSSQGWCRVCHTVNGIRRLQVQLFTCFLTFLQAKIASRFAEKLIKASKGEKGIVEPAYVYLPGVPGGVDIANETGVDYFSVPVELGVCRHNPLYLCFSGLLNILQPSGAEKATNPLSDINANERQLLEACKTGLKDNIQKGVEFAQCPPPK